MEQDVSNRVIYSPCNEMITARVSNKPLGINSTFNYCSLKCFTNSIAEWYQRGVFNDECDMHIVCREITKEDIKDD
jgi:hypothetical protein